MKRIFFTLALLLMAVPPAMAQNLCAGIHNPVSFVYHSAAAAPSNGGKLSGQTGTKQEAVSTCAANSITLSGGALSGAALAAVSTGSSCSNNLGTDYMNHFVIKSSGTDPLTNNHLPFLPDTTFQRSIRIGNSCGGAEADVLYYDFYVEKNNSLVTIYFAISLYNSLHSAAGNPEFTIKVKRLNNNTGNYELISDALCYIVQSPTSSSQLGVFQTGGANNIYRPWNKVVINLYDYIYDYVRIEVATGDCAYSAHYGYGYVAGRCAPMDLVANGCAAGASDTIATVTAPSGLLEYKWYKCDVGNGMGLGGAADVNTDNYTELVGYTDSTLAVRTEDFVLNGETLSRRRFMCVMKSAMNPSYPIYTALTVDVGNMKPRLEVDSVLYCDGTVYLKDRSAVAFDNNDDSNKVDTANTRWIIYRGSAPTDNDSLTTIVGAHMNYTFEQGGVHSIMVRSHAYRSECWNEKLVHVRSLQQPTPQVVFSQTIYCKGDSVILTDETMDPANGVQKSAYRKWVLHKANGVKDTIETTGTFPGQRRLTFVCDTTTRVEMWTRTEQVTYRDTNADGVVDPIYCYGYLDTVVPVENYPVLQVQGDTIVCYGNDSRVNVNCTNASNASYAWYRQLNGSNPIGTNAELTESNVTTNKRYFVKVETAGAHCATWDSIFITLVEPTLTVPVTRLCTDDYIYLYADGASNYTWSSVPDDPTLAGQYDKDTIRVSPASTTTYTLVGHGSNGCSADPLTSTVTVFPYPIPTFTLDPGFIDSEEPVVTFSDKSPNSVTSLWNFGNGMTSTQRTVSQRFTDISQDSIQVSLTSGNELNCTSDTTFWVPIDLFSIWFPNVFTPTLNANTKFQCYTHNELQYYSLYIYDRNGHLVFHSTDQNEAWDGKYKGKLCPQGSYVYMCNYRRDGTFEITHLKGTVLLLQ